jgi:MerR HTH family regulatory protein
VPSIRPDRPDKELLKPREVAELCGVNVATIGLWARTGRLKNDVTTPGGHRRYRLADVRELLQSLATPRDPEQEQFEVDAVRLYEQGCGIRQVAEKFDYSYGAMRRILSRRTTLSTAVRDRDLCGSEGSATRDSRPVILMCEDQ